MKNLILIACVVMAFSCKQKRVKKAKEVCLVGQYQSASQMTDTGIKFEKKFNQFDCFPQNNTLNYEKYELSIYNRWGMSLFKSNDPKIKWLCSNKQCSDSIKNGNYYYYIKYKSNLDTADKIQSGIFTVIRK